MRSAALLGACLFVGLVLVLPEIRWFRRRTLTDRLQPYLAHAVPVLASTDGTTVWQALVPLASSAGEALAKAFEWNDSLAVRLDRVHADVDVSGFRMRQLGWSAAAFGAAAFVTVAVGAPGLIVLVVCAVSCVAGFAAPELFLARATASRQAALLLELPVVAEQLGMLLGAGYSLGAAIERIAVRGEGACARDLRRVCTRISHGLSDADALREWAAVSGVRSVERLVAVLALNREATDLGRLVSDEARTTRREVHRSLIERIERRGQQVWVPVTVATLVPGVIFLAVPFIEALRLFAST